MTDLGVPQAAGARSGSRAEPGRIEKTLIRWLMRDATVASAEPMSAGFRLIELAGEALKGVTWVPGQKIQVMMGGLFTARTFTPIEWDADRGSTRILAWSHGAGPGSDWAVALSTGDRCQFFGPRRSLDIAGIDGPLVLFGDETSFGLALAIQYWSGCGREFQTVFEAADAREASTVLTKLGIAGATVAERRFDESHLPEIEARLVHLASEGATCILTGRAPAIQKVHQSLKRAGIPAGRIRNKAYWAPGKTGLD